MMRKLLPGPFCALLLVFLIGVASPGALAAAQPTAPSAGTPALRVQPNEIRITGLGDNSAIQIAILLTCLSLVPALILCVTPFARLLVVFHFLRQALGLQTTPSNQTLIGLGLILTFFLMQPVGTHVYRDALEPYQRGALPLTDALNQGAKPLKSFMLHFVRDKDMALFVDLSKEPRPHNSSEVSMRVLVPAYILSELRAGFQIGAVLFLPFLVIDMVVASITTSIGMFQLPPVVVSTPLKLLLFVMVDGWHLLVGSLMKSFA